MTPCCQPSLICLERSVACLTASVNNGSCPFVAYSSKDKRGKCLSMQGSPLEKSQRGTFCSLCLSLGMPMLLDKCQLCIRTRSPTSPSSSAVLQRYGAVEKDWKRNPCDILLARLICGWIGGKSSPPSSDNSDHQHLSTLAASCPRRMETAAKSYYFHHHCVLSAPNNPLDPLNPGVTLCRTWPPVQGVSPLRYLPCQKSELCRVGL